MSAQPPAERTLEEVFPGGQRFWYEGQHPAWFVAFVHAEYGFDPSADLGWNVYDPDCPDDRANNYQFYCPPQHIKAPPGRPDS